MAETIKGITVVLGADTTALSKALGDVNKKSRDIQKELKEVDKLLKLDPKNTDLLAQKQKLLSEAVQTTKDKLDTLKTSQQQVNDQFAKGEINEGQYRAYQREVAKTEQELKKFEQQLKDTEPAVKSLGEKMDESGEKIKSAGEKIGNVGKSMTAKVTTPIVALGGLALKAGIDFEAGMSRVEAISGATGDSLDQLKGQAKQLGESTVFSASQAAEGMEYLALAGWGVEEIYSAMPAMLNLAAAGALDLGRAADITSDTMSAFGLSASDAAHAADVFAYAQAKANTSVNQMGEAMNYLAPTANSLGWTLEESSAIIMKLADSGLKGSMATQAFGTSLVRLAAPTPKATKLIKDLGMEFFNAEGQMKSMPEVLAEMEKGLEGMSDQQKAATMDVLVGKNAFKQWQILLDTGSDSLAELTQNLIESDGSAQKMADTMTDNAKGGLIELKSTLEGLAIQLSEIMIPIFNKVVDALKGIVSWFAGLDEGTQTTILIIAGIVAAIGPLLIIVGQIITAIGALAPVFAALTGPIGIAVAAIAGITAVIVTLYNKNEEFREFIDKTWAAIKDIFQSVWQEIVNFVKPIIEDLSEFFKSIFNDLKEFWQTHGELIMAFIKPWLTGLVGFFKVQFEGIKIVISTAFILIKATIKTAIEAIKLVISTTLDIIMGIVRVFTKLLQGDWKGAWDEIKNTAQNIMENIIKFFKNIDLVQVGKDIINGLIKGIGSMAGAVVDTVKDVAGKLVGGIKGALNINSPSKVMEQLGEWTGEGLIVGMKNTVNAIHNQATQLAHAAVPDMQQQGANVASGANISFEGMFAGANFNVRSESDIKAIARELFTLQQNALRGAGVR